MGIRNLESGIQPRGLSHVKSTASLSMSAPQASQLFHHQLSGFDQYTGLPQEYMHPATLQSPFYLHNPMALKAKKSKDPDLPSTQEALAGPLADEFLEEKGTRTVVPRTSVPRE